MADFKLPTSQEGHAPLLLQAGVTHLQPQTEGAGASQATSISVLVSTETLKLNKTSPGSVICFLNEALRPIRRLFTQTHTTLPFVSVLRPSGSDTDRFFPIGPRWTRSSPGHLQREQSWQERMGRLHRPSWPPHSEEQLRQLGIRP